MMLGFEVLMKKYVFCIILDCYSSPGELGISALCSSSPFSSPWRKISPGEEIFGLAKLTVHHVLPIHFVASMGYPRLDLAVPY
jgi:hypothetical protein